ncbi:MAG TPA: LysR substrate-binding domain-containing protein [Candidatus Binatia bacterium]|jgi:DNA-binding transcriptional LysR family regulator
MDLRRLKYFVTVAEELHFGRAAKRLHITQPPLSQQIQLLEHELDMMLFNRTRRRVELTSIGKVFLVEARALLQQSDDAVARTRRVQRGEAGRLSIGWMPWSVLTPLPFMIREFCQRFPEVHLDVHSLSAEGQLEALHEGTIDAGFVLWISDFGLPSRTGPLKTEIVLKPPLVVVVPQNHRFAAAGRVELADLTNEPYILFKRESGQVFYDYVISFYQRNGLRLNIRHEADHPSTVLGLVAAGLGITILPFTSTHAIPGVVCCDLPAASPQLEIALTWRPQNESTLLANFTETIRNYRLLEENVSGREGTGLERLKAG